MRKMIFHIPLPLEDNPVSASGFRPVQILKAFRDCGYEVYDVTGYGAERKRKTKELKRLLAQGETFDFLYSESSTQPTLLTEKNHLPTFPFVDFGLFSLCKKNNIKIGLFYRDIHWRFPFYNDTTSAFKARVAKFFYQYDIKQYRKLLDVMFLPSIQMAKYVPEIPSLKIEELPPGHGIEKANETTLHNDKINLTYVGGLGDIYQLHELFAIGDHPGFHIQVSTRKENWEVVKNNYPSHHHIEVVSAFGEDAKNLFRKSHIGLLFVKPVEYWTFAMPYKLFEYIGYGLPIIASEGTLSAEVVKKYDIGWVIPYEAKKLGLLLDTLAKDAGEIERKMKNIAAVRDLHSWKARAQKVINMMT